MGVYTRVLFPSGDLHEKRDSVWDWGLCFVGIAASLLEMAAPGSSHPIGGSSNSMVVRFPEHYSLGDPQVGNIPFCDPSKKGGYYLPCIGPSP